jgi:predicted enzyme related to lactoylglutathione lyase
LLAGVAAARFAGALAVRFTIQRYGYGPIMSDGSGYELRSVVIGCPDPPSLALFYGDLLRGTVHADPDWSEVRFERGGPKLAFQRIDHYVTPQWPDGRPQQFHLDATVADLGAASRRAVQLGGQVLGEPVDEDGCTFQVHADPSGHPFCLIVDR